MTRIGKRELRRLQLQDSELKLVITLCVLVTVVLHMKKTMYSTFGLLVIYVTSGIVVYVKGCLTHLRRKSMCALNVVMLEIFFIFSFVDYNNNYIILNSLL